MSKRRQIQVLYPHFEEVTGSIEPWLIARWKARLKILLSVIELLLTVRCNARIASAVLATAIASVSLSHAGIVSK